MTTAAATETFNDCTKPLMGMTIVVSAASKKGFEIPKDSFPITIALGVVQSLSHWLTPVSESAVTLIARLRDRKSSMHFSALSHFLISSHFKADLDEGANSAIRGGRASS